MQYGRMQYGRMQFGRMQFGRMQFGRMQFGRMQYAPTARRNNLPLYASRTMYLWGDAFMGKVELSQLFRACNPNYTLDLSKVKFHLRVI
ncbi:MAG: hypothetical protein F6K47_15130 [Symploca sp. SIO2E6]|nr:hypothetical protein [Symploca sp. SIO2E6]